MDRQKITEYAVLLGKVAAFMAVLVFLYFYGNLVLETISQAAGGQSSVQKILPALLDVFTLVIGTQVFLIISRYAISKYLENRGKKKEIKIILSLYTYLVWAFVGVFLVSTIFKDLGALITSLGLIGFGITFALQKPILNFVGWLAIVVNKPFNIADRIEVSGIRGDVVSIHTMYTRVQGSRTNSHEKSEKIISIPNELILTNPVINFSKSGELYSDDLTVSITYESNWRKASELLQKAAENTMKKFVKNNIPASFAEKKAWHEAMALLQEASKKLRRGGMKESVKEKIEIMKTAENISASSVQKPNVQVNFADSAINLNVLYQTDLRSIRDSRNEISRTFLEEVEKRDDIEIAYPHMQIVYSDSMKKFSAKQKKLFKGEQPENQPGQPLNERQ